MNEKIIIWAYCGLLVCHVIFLFWVWGDAVCNLASVSHRISPQQHHRNNSTAPPHHGPSTAALLPAPGLGPHTAVQHPGASSRRGMVLITVPHNGFIKPSHLCHKVVMHVQFRMRSCCWGWRRFWRTARRAGAWGWGTSSPPSTTGRCNTSSSLHCTVLCCTVLYCTWRCTPRGGGWSPSSAARPPPSRCPARGRARGCRGCPTSRQPVRLCIMFRRRQRCSQQVTTMIINRLYKMHAFNWKKRNFRGVFF